MAVLPDITFEQYNMVYNALSFGIAGMGAACLFVIFQLGNVSKKYRTALIINSLVTAIATYHYFRIFNSWDGAYSVGEKVVNGTAVYSVTKSGAPFNDAYRYVDWLLTVPLLLIELVLVMDLSAARTKALAWQLSIAACLMVLIGYPGEVSENNKVRWICLILALLPFFFILYNLLVGLASAADPDEHDSGDEEEAMVKSDVYYNEKVQCLISAARYLTAVSWLTYPFVYAIKALPDIAGAKAMAWEQVGYSMADLVAKAVFGILIWAIASTKSEIEEEATKRQ